MRLLVFFLIAAIFTAAGKVQAGDDPGLQKEAAITGQTTDCTTPSPIRAEGRAHVSAVYKVTRPVPAAQDKHEAAKARQQCEDIKIHQANQEKIREITRGKAAGLRDPGAGKGVITPMGDDSD